MTPVWGDWLVLHGQMRGIGGCVDTGPRFFVLEDLPNSRLSQALSKFLNSFAQELRELCELGKPSSNI